MAFNCGRGSRHARLPDSDFKNPTQSMMKKSAKTAGVHKIDSDAKESLAHPVVRWWPLNTPRLTGKPFENPVARIPTVNSPIAKREES